MKTFLFYVAILGGCYLLLGIAGLLVCAFAVLIDGLHELIQVTEERRK